MFALFHELMKIVLWSWVLLLCCHDPSQDGKVDRVTYDAMNDQQRM